MKPFILLAGFCLALMSAVLSKELSPQSARIIYDDNLAQGWSDWSWASVDLQAAAPVHGGACSIAVTAGAWQGLYLHHPDLPTLGYSHLRFYVNGGSTGGQHMTLKASFNTSGGSQDGPQVDLALPEANTWTEVLVSLESLGSANRSINGLTWQEAQGKVQPTLYIDDIALVALETPGGPLLSGGKFSPAAVPADGKTGSVVKVQVSHPQGLGEIAWVSLEIKGVNGSLGSPLSLFDDGSSNDGAAGDGIFGGFLTTPANTPTGEYALLITAQDKQGRKTSLYLGVLDVLTPPGGHVPAALPEHIGWGSNAWEDDPAYDWQVKSGVPWDYVYQYITYDWYVNGWGGNFVTRFVTQAWEKNYIPLISVYMFLELPPNCGETPTCYAQKLQNSSSVQTYLAAIQAAAIEARGSKPVIFHLEPDFYGYMQQLSNSSARPAGVVPDDPNSYPVSLNKPGYANTLAGFGEYVVDLIHTSAPNVLTAPGASMWSTNNDPNNVSAQEAQEMGRRTAMFIDAMGGNRSDLLVVEWSDRDAGSGLRPWWGRHQP